MNEKEVLEKIILIFSEVSEEKNITEESELIKDLGLSSIDVFTLLADLEIAFNIRIPEKMVRKMGTIEDVKYIVLDILNELPR